MTFLWKNVEDISAESVFAMCDSCRKIYTVPFGRCLMALCLPPPTYPQK